jgi:hypothetical protein
VAYAWAVTLGTEQGVQMLRRTGLLDAAVEYAAESGAFQQAFALASAAGLKTAVADIHLRYAMALEDEGRFGEAEQEFVAAGGLIGAGAWGWWPWTMVLWAKHAASVHLSARGIVLPWHVDDLSLWQ